MVVLVVAMAAVVVFLFAFGPQTLTEDNCRLDQTTCSASASDAFFPSEILLCFLALSKVSTCRFCTVFFVLNHVQLSPKAVVSVCLHVFHAA